MSNFLAIATVTAALNQVIADAVTADVTGVEVKVTNVRPGGEPVQTPATGVNVFLYSVTPNGHLLENDLPTRRGNGEPIQRPVLALDLHYLLTFYGDDNDYLTQRLLGSVVRTLHAAPTLPRAKLVEVVGSRPALDGSDLPDTVQAVRFTPVSLSLEELSKLWSFLFQTPYALSAAYRGTAVLIEGTETPRPALPVRARSVVTVPFANPVLERVESDQGPDEPIVGTSTIVLRGRRLRGEVTRVRIGGVEVAPAEVRDREITLALTSVPAANLRAGVQGVSVVHHRLLGIPPQPHRAEESNSAPLVLRPQVVASSYAAPTLSVTVSPTVGRTQRAEMLLNELASPTPKSMSFVSPRRTADATTITFDAPGIDAATYLVRARVDGAESPLVADAAGVPSQPQLVVS
jgi:hypothetical protein